MVGNWFEVTASSEKHLGLHHVLFRPDQIHYLKWSKTAASLSRAVKKLTTVQTALDLQALCSWESLGKAEKFQDCVMQSRDYINSKIA